MARYTPEMMATLLLPAGVTSEASIRYKDEAELLDKRRMWTRRMCSRCCRENGI